MRILRESNTHIAENVDVLTDTGFQGMQKMHTKTRMPKKSSKNKPLTKAEKQNNRKLSSERVINEHVIGSVKRFKIVADKYRNRRKRFGLRFNLIAGIHNFELQ